MLQQLMEPKDELEQPGSDNQEQEINKIKEINARKIIASKEEVEIMHNSGQRTEKGLKVSASSVANGFCLFSDNVGKIINPR